MIINKLQRLAQRKSASFGNLRWDIVIPASDYLGMSSSVLVKTERTIILVLSVRLDKIETYLPKYLKGVNRSENACVKSGFYVSWNM